MPTSLNAQVLIVGGGPVGLTLAMDLAGRGIDVAVAETRAAGEPPSVRCNHVAARTMEIFRRLGLVRAVREAGLPANYPNDVSFRTTATGIELSRIPIPCSAERYTARGGPDTWWPTPEPPHRINQIYLEPILFAHAAARPRLRILSRTRILGFLQNETEVVATAEDLAGGEALRIIASYMIGCDGAHSEIRRGIGAVMSGDPLVTTTQSTYIRAPKLLGMMPAPAWCTKTLNPWHNASIFAIDGRERWLIHNWLSPGQDFAAVDRKRCIREILGVETSFEFEVLGQEDWTGRRMIADRFRDRRVFLCGDAAHIWVPAAGYGMNAGIADAMNLSWMLAGVVKGWADSAILRAYEIERQPITEQVSRYAMGTVRATAAFQSAVLEGLEKPGPEGDAARARIGREAYALNVGQFCCGGSTSVTSTRTPRSSPMTAKRPPPYTMYGFSQSTVPGCRTPHLWLRDGRSLYDALGSEFTLLRFDPAIEVGDLLGAAAKRGLPMALLDVNENKAALVYPRKLLISRPDQHVAWRGDKPPDDPTALIDRIRGALPGRNFARPTD
jgi:2-polyprenyl-6-methoxyphenol hydroxylase-like FAD-dependent oxidoreductase